VDAAERNVAAQDDDPGSTLSFWRRLIALRRDLDGDLEMIDSEPDVLAFRRGEHTTAISFAPDARTLPSGEVLLATEPVGTSLPPGAGVVARGT
jgi:alpha-glucosidase